MSVADFDTDFFFEPMLKISSYFILSFHVFSFYSGLLLHCNKSE